MSTASTNPARAQATMTRNNAMKAVLSGNPVISLLNYHIFNNFATSGLMGTRISRPTKVHAHRTEIVRRKSKVELRPVKGVPLWPEGLNTALRSEGSEFGSATLIPYGGSIVKKLLVVLSLVVMLLVAVTPASAGGRAVEVEELQCGFIAVSLAEKISSYSLIVTLRSADGTSSRAQLVAMFGGSRYWYATHPDSWTPEPGVWKVVRVRSTNGEFDQWIGHRDIAVTCGGGDGSTSEGNLL